MNELIDGLRKSEKKQFFYIICRILLLLTVLLPGIFLVEILLVEIEKKYNIPYKTINIIVAIIICFGGTVFIVKRIIKRAELSKKGIIIEARFSKEEFVSLSPSASMPGKYIIVGYYIQNNVTYRFNQIFFEDQLKLYNIMRVINEKGKFPAKIYVQVDDRDYGNYKMLGYEFLEETLKNNKNIVEQELYGFNVF